MSDFAIPLTESEEDATSSEEEVEEVKEQAEDGSKKASIISHILARWQAIQSHYSQQLQSHLSRSVNVQKAGSGAW